MAVRDRHGWNSYENYRFVHDENMLRFGHFILHDGLEWLPKFGRVHINGVILFLEGLELHVTKELETDFRSGRSKVRTYRYSYHLLQRRVDQVDNIFRFDNYHAHYEHSDHHHYHALEGMDIDGTVTHIGAERWPTLGEVIERVERYWAKSTQAIADRTRHLPSP